MQVQWISETVALYRILLSTCDWTFEWFHSCHSLEKTFNPTNIENLSWMLPEHLHSLELMNAVSATCWGNIVDTWSYISECHFEIQHFLNHQIQIQDCHSKYSNKTQNQCDSVPWYDSSAATLFGEYFYHNKYWKFVLNGTWTFVLTWVTACTTCYMLVY